MTSTRLEGVTVLLALALLAGCGGGDRSERPQDQPATQGRGAPAEWFVDRARDTGLDFVHFNGLSGEYFVPENLAPGIAVFDYDSDGDLDVFLVQGRMLGHTPIERARIPPKDPGALKGRLFRNDLAVRSDRTPTLQFTDVTDKSGIDARGYGMGAAAGDYNNDGCVDLYLTNFGANQLFRNNCDGTFTDVSRPSGTESPGWSSSASFVDYDRDGWLDLFVAHYLDYTVEADKKCPGLASARDFCYPAPYQSQPSRLYHNDGNGTFSDVTKKALVGGEYGGALGVAAADLNGDGWVDIFVANDSSENQLWINQHDGTFRNTALLAGVALTVDGQAESNMGVDAGDVDNDGDEDLIITELTNQGHNFYVNDRTGTFEDRSLRSGVGPLTLPYTGFGAGWLDFDNDGWLDILTVNGTIKAIEAQRQAHEPFPQRQRKQLLRNLGHGRFEDVSDRAGEVFKVADVGRGAAFGDIDNDGDMDVLVGNDGGRVQLLINQIGSAKHWIGLRLVGAGRDQLGARVSVSRQEGMTIWRRARSDGSYASANDPRVLAGLGDSTETPTVRVQWPDGRTEEWRDVAIDRYTTLEQGGGK